MTVHDRRVHRVKNRNSSSIDEYRERRRMYKEDGICGEKVQERMKSSHQKILH